MSFGKGSFMAVRGRTVVLAAMALLLGAAQARAGFSYATTVTFSPAGTGGTSPGVVITPALLNINGFTENGYAASFGKTSVDLVGASRNAFSVPGNDTLDAADLVATSSTPVGTTGDTFTLGYTLQMTLTNFPPPPGSLDSQNFDVSGILTMSNVNGGTGTLNNTFTTPTSGDLDIGDISFSAAINTFSPPTVNGSSGSIGGDVQASIVPEPASTTLIVLGTLPILRRTRRVID